MRFRLWYAEGAFSDLLLAVQNWNVEGSCIHHAMALELNPDPVNSSAMDVHVELKQFIGAACGIGGRERVIVDHIDQV
jgi:hypothetical protein